MAAYYWVGGSGTWDNSNTANWSTSSGGAGGAGPPTASDTAYIAPSSYASSFTITLASTAAALYAIIGNTNVTVQQSGDVSNIGTFYLYGGTYNANNYNVTAGSFQMASGYVDGVLINGPRTLTMGSGLWTLNGSGTVWSGISSNTTFNKNTANIVLNCSSSPTFVGGGLTYNKLTLAGTATTYSLQENATFLELASTVSNAFTVQLSNSPTISTYTWSISGSAGNVVTVSNSGGSGASLIKLGGGYVAGVDYMTIGNNITATPTDTWYFGSNSTYTASRPNSTTGIFNTTRFQNAVVVLTSTSSSTWTVPLDWNNNNNTIHLIGGGGGGAGGGQLTTSPNTIYGGGGGGGGGYTKLTNQSLTIGSSITYQAGSAGSGGIGSTSGVDGGTTSWNSGASTAGGGSGGNWQSTGGTGGTGSTYNGGAGGNGGASLNLANYTAAGGGGGGAGGPNGVGGAGGVGSSNTTSSLAVGGGGGGNGGGTAGGIGNAWAGGNNSSGIGGGVSVGQAGTQGGGSSGGGDLTPHNTGGSGIEIFGVGSGGGMGGRGSSGTLNAIRGGNFGGGGGGGYSTTFGSSGRVGAQGAIIIVYTPISPGSFLTFFEP